MISCFSSICHADYEVFPLDTRLRLCFIELLQIYHEALFMCEHGSEIEEVIMFSLINFESSW